MRLLLAVMLTTNFAHAMDGEMEVQQQPRAIPTKLTAQMYSRVIAIRQQIAQGRKVAIEDLTNTMHKSTSQEKAEQTIRTLNSKYQHNDKENQVN